MSTMTMGTSLRATRSENGRTPGSPSGGIYVPQARAHSVSVPRTSTRNVAAHEVHLTRRGRALVSIIALLCSGVVGAVVVGFATAGDVSAATTQTRPYSVKPGETLWSIARSINPQGDPRETIAVLQQLNPQTREQLLSGETINIPR